MSKWTPETVSFIRNQYLVERKSAGEIAKALNFAFSRNAVTGKLLRIGALQERAGILLGKQHGLPKHVLPKRVPVPLADVRQAKAPSHAGPRISTPADAGQELPNGDLSFVARTEALFQDPGLSLFQATVRHCRWPAKTRLEIPHVCGKPRSRGAYCPEHAAIAYVDVRPRLRIRKTRD